MSVGNIFRSDLYSIHNIVQNSLIVYPKEIIIATLKDFFSLDSYYHYVRDAWGFTLTPDHTNLPLTAGYALPNTITPDNSTTRLFIGENYRYDNIFYPAILVKHGGAHYTPVSINRDTTKVKWSERLFIDGYGQEYIVRNPEHFVYSGAWEGSIIVDVKSRSLRARDDLVELIGICFTQITYESLRRAGVIVKPVQIGAPSETEDRNDKLFSQSVTLNIRSEWQVNAPITNVIDIINFVIIFGRVGELNYPTDPNFTINSQSRLTDVVDLILSGEPLPYFSPLYQPKKPPPPLIY